MPWIQMLSRFAARAWLPLVPPPELGTNLTVAVGRAGLPGPSLREADMLPGSCIEPRCGTNGTRESGFPGAPAARHTGTVRGRHHHPFPSDGPSASPAGPGCLPPGPARLFGGGRGALPGSSQNCRLRAERLQTIPATQTPLNVQHLLPFRSFVILRFYFGLA